MTIKRTVLALLIVLAAIGAPIGAKSIAQADDPHIPCAAC